MESACGHCSGCWEYSNEQTGSSQGANEHMEERLDEVGYKPGKVSLKRGPFNLGEGHSRWKKERVQRPRGGNE